VLAITYLTNGTRSRFDSTTLKETKEFTGIQYEPTNETEPQEQGQERERPLGSTHVKKPTPPDQLDSWPLNQSWTIILHGRGSSSVTGSTTTS
jgi:hypothetical protein